MCINKKELRKKISELKKQLSSSQILEYSTVIKDKLFDMDEYKHSEHICIYMSYNQEVITKDIILNSLKINKKVALPKISNNVMDFYYIKSMNELVSGFHGILEPITNIKMDVCKGLMIMPGLAFDRQMNRLGYGGGFYDRYLEERKDYIKIALAYDFQIVDNVFNKDHDVKVNYIITQENIYGED